MANARYWVNVKYVDGGFDVSTHSNHKAAKAAAKAALAQLHRHTGAAVALTEVTERLSNGAFLSHEVYRP